MSSPEPARDLQNTTHAHLRYNGPMKTHVIIKTHESALKGKNRPMFMRRLADNVRRAVEGTGVERVWLAHMMVGVTMSKNSDWDEVRERVRDCMGVAKFFPATETPLDLEAVKEHIATELKDKNFKTFRISAHRSDKRFPIKSIKINEELGTFVLGITDAKVQLKNPDLEIYLDVLPKGILVYFDEVRGYGGLPVGVSGRLMALLSGGIDSRSVIVKHTFRIARRARRVTERRRRPLVEFGPFVVSRLGRQKRFVTDDIIE